MNKKNKINKRFSFVLIVLIIALICGYIVYKGSYLEIIEIGEEFTKAFNKNIEYLGMAFITNFIIVFFSLFVTTIFVKKGVKVFFEQENKEIPKLPNKSIAFIGAMLSSIVVSFIVLKKAVLFFGAAFFEKSTPIFGYDIGYFVFQKPFIETIILYFLVLIIVLLLYAVVYYIIVFNKYLEGIDKETFKNSIFIKQIINNVITLSVLAGVYIFFKTQDVVFQKFINLNGQIDYSLYGAGILDTSIKLWGYRILAIIIVFVVIFALKFLKQKNTKKVLKTLFIVPAYLLLLFIVLTIGNLVFVKPNELDVQKDFINYNISATKTAYGIDIQELNIDDEGTITKSMVNENSNVINNINMLSEEVLLKDLNGSQTSKKYYYYKHTQIGRYDINGESKLVYLSPREIINSESTRTYNNKTYEYTHGFGVIITSASTVNQNGNLETLQKGFEEQEVLNIKEPRIYYGLSTNNTVVINNNNKQEFDYPIIDSNDATNEVNTYNGESGLSLSFIDRIILSIKEKNLKLAISENVENNSKFLINRNIVQRAKKIMPDLIYDENPYIVINDEGKMIWVLDAYTVSNNYPYSQKTYIEVDGERREINYIRNSVKVLIDAYNGTIKFYIIDRTDPIVMVYNNMYPEVFESTESKIPQDISKHFVYPKFLYNIQTTILQKYHNISADVLYRADDIWEKASKNSGKVVSKVGTEINPYYTMIKEKNEEAKLGLILPFTPYEKQNVISYAVGSCDENGNNNLKIYKFSEDSNILGPIQLDTQIEQNENISNEIESLDTTGVRLIRNMVIVPINNTLLYVEPIYQIYTNEVNALPTLKKVVVASGNKIAIGNDLAHALESLLSQNAADIEVENTDNIEDLIETIIKANKNLEISTNNQDWEMIGKDMSKLQNLINKLEILRQEEVDKEELENEELENEELENIEINSITEIINDVQ